MRALIIFFVLLLGASAENSLHRMREALDYMAYYKLRETDLSPRDWSGFSPRERVVLDCVTGFQIIIYGERGRKAVSHTTNPARAIFRVTSARLDGGRAAVYAVRDGTTESFLAHVTLDMIRKMRWVLEPPLPPINGGA